MVVAPFDVVSFMNLQGIPWGQKKQLNPGEKKGIETQVSVAEHCTASF
jgi:hypothetical protein